MTIPLGKKVLYFALSAMLFAVCASAAAQQTKKIPKIGALFPGNAAATAHLHLAFRQGLRERGYVQGKNFALELRYGEARAERISAAARELVSLKVDVIVTATDIAIAAVKQQTSTIPIVMANSTDPVGTGFVESLARPGGNVTGHSTISPELSGKPLELLIEVLPGLSRVAFLWNPEIRGALLDYKETESVARSLGLQLLSVAVPRAEDFDRAFVAVTNGRTQALIVPAVKPVTFTNRGRLARFAETNRLLSMYAQYEYVDAGGLMSYGPSLTEHWRHAATFVDKILKGAKPTDLPVEQPTKFELVINLKTAKHIGLKIPQSVLYRADKVIK